jgi:chromosome segregation ATPase
MTATLEERVTSLESRMDEQEGLRASQDSDLSDIAEFVRAQSGLMKALAKTQSDHGKMLARHTATLDQIVATLDQQTEILDRHSTILDRHSTILGQHSTILDRHSETLDRHSTILDRHSTILGELKTGLAFQSLKLGGMVDGQQRVIGMLDTLIQRDQDR